MEIITITYECRRPKFDVDENEQQEVLMLTSSCVAAVDVLINGQALSTQAQRSALTHFAIYPFLDLLLLHQLRLCCYYINFVFARVDRALFQVRFFQVPTLVPFPVRAHKRLLRRGNTESCSKVSRAAGKPRHLSDIRHPVNQRHAFFIAFYFELMPFSLNMLRLSVFTSG